MKLQYRGISYYYTPQNVKTHSTKVEAKFRGSTYSVCSAINPTLQNTLNLKYRGIDYTTNQVTAIQLPSQPISSNFESAFI